MTFYALVVPFNAEIVNCLHELHLMILFISFNNLRDFAIKEIMLSNLEYVFFCFFIFLYPHSAGEKVYCFILVHVSVTIFSVTVFPATAHHSGLKILHFLLVGMPSSFWNLFLEKFNFKLVFTEDFIYFLYIVIESKGTLGAIAH